MTSPCLTLVEGILEGHIDTVTGPDRATSEEVVGGLETLPEDLDAALPVADFTKRHEYNCLVASSLMGDTVSSMLW